MVTSLFLTMVNGASEGHLEVGKLWIGPAISNYGYMGVFEFPGGAKDFYIVEQSSFFSAVINGDEHVLYGGTLGNELDFGWQNADGKYENWQSFGDDIGQTYLTASSDFSNSTDGDLQIDLATGVRAFNHPSYDDFVIVEHTFTNTGTGTITEFYYGSHLPVDMGASGISYKDLDDYGEHDSISGLTYMYDDDGDDGLTPYYTGQVLLGVNQGNSLDTSAVWTTALFYQMVNPIAGKDDMLNKIKNGITETTGAPGPWSILNAAGPYSIAPGQSITFTMAVVYGEGLSGILSNVYAARKIAAYNFVIPLDETPPPVPVITDINVASRVIELEWISDLSSDFLQYNIYKSDVSTVGPWTLIEETVDSKYIDIGQSGFPLYYTITAVDIDGNETGLWGKANRTLDAVRPLGKAVTSLGEVLVVPNPYIGGANWETYDYDNRLYFTQLPEKCTIYIYNLMGDLVKILPHNLIGDTTIDGSGDESWDLLSKNRQTIASGMYLFRAVAENGDETSGRFVIVKGQR